MAEAVVGVLIDKLGEALLSEAAAYCASLLCTETSALKGLFGEIRRAVGWLEIMKAYLQDMEKFKNTNKTTDAFIKKIRGLAFRMEDVVDEFKYKLEDNKHGGLAVKMKKRIKHVKVWHRLAIELHDINADLEDAAKKRNLFVIPEMERYGGGNYHHTGSINPTSCFAREEDLVGIKDNAEKLKEWLLDISEENKSRIITVWGMGGAGKTTLVDHVYKTLKEDFDFAAWLTVSKSYQIEDLLKKIARDFGISVDASNMDLRNLVEVIRHHLNGKRYILVLDDVWENDVWMKIMDIFPSNCISRFILTSRNFEVASLATDNCAIMLKPLEDDLSWELFCNVAFRNSDDRRCPSELQDLATKFLQQCEGLPLAIACIGRLLSCKPPTYYAWKIVCEELELQWTKHMIPAVDSILKVSLDDISYELKNCFLHCAMFPEDYEIKRRRLIRHWITAGFIKEKGNKTLEEVAEGYLNELVNRSLLQVIQKNQFGRVKCCRMHDIVRHLALDKAEEECFGTVYEGSRFSKAGLRRLSIQSANISPLSHSDATRIRAIYAFNRNLDVDLLRPILSSSSLMSILDLQGTQVKVLPNEVFSLFNLRFLGIRDTKIEILPEGIRRLQNLEVLDASGTGLMSLPKGMAKLKKLRCLYAHTMVSDGGMGHMISGVKVPRGLGNLTELHDLQDVKTSLETLCDVAALTKLRSFAISDVKSEHASTLCATIMNMSHLVHLRISASDQNEILQLEALHLPETLSSLELHGLLEKKFMPQIFSCLSHLTNLTKMYLRWSKFDEHSFSRLLLLPSLCKLTMFKAYDGKELRFPVHSFPKLRELQIYGAPQLNQVEIEEGALERLVVLRLSGCPELKCLPRGIEYLTTLKILVLRDTSEELIEKLRLKREAVECTQEFMKIDHITKVVVILTEKNIWERIS